MNGSRGNRRGVGASADAAEFERARALLDSGRGAEAAEILGPLSKRNRDNANVWIMLALAELSVFDLERALGHVRKAISLRPSFGPYYYELARVLMTMGDLEGADGAIAEAARLGVGEDHLSSLRSESLRVQGRYEEAREALDAAMRSENPPPRTSRTLALLSSKLGNQEEAEAFTKRLIEWAGDPAEESRFRFDLSLIYDRAGRHEEAFDEASEAHRLRLGESRGINALRCAIDEMIDAWTPEAVERIGDSGIESESPVFVVGMPRSGSTLTEMMLAAHPLVGGLGEVESIWLALPEIDGRGMYESHPVTDLSRVKRSGLKRMAQAFLRRAGKIAPNATRVIDKNLMNWMYAGPIALALPGAKFIRCERDALDCCVSCWMLDLEVLRVHGNTFEGLAGYREQCERALDHWESLFPDRFVTVRYERIVEDPEEEIGRALDHIGVEWDDACLRFYDTKNAALTWSNDQVRQPLYRGSIGRAERYGERVEPLRAALGI